VFRCAIRFKLLFLSFQRKAHLYTTLIRHLIIKNINIMNPRILQMKRMTFKKKYQDWDYKIVKNPLYDAKVYKDCFMRGVNYNIPEYIEKEVLVTTTKKCSHIEYRIKCDHCKSTIGWVRRQDAKFCSPNCRKLAYKEKQKKII
jgi:hypothetical protein